MSLFERDDKEEYTPLTQSNHYESWINVYKDRTPVHTDDIKLLVWYLRPLPLTLSEDEVDAILLVLRRVANQSDKARNLLMRLLNVYHIIDKEYGSTLHDQL